MKFQLRKLFVSQRQLWLLVALLVLAIFTRFSFLKISAPFFWDQAYDLRQMQLFREERRLTLIGPISENGDKIYSALTYYLLLPFAILGNFSAVSTTYGAAFYGLIAAIFLSILLYLINKKTVLPAVFLIAIWFPLVETSRWAWNPHLVLLWIPLGLIFLHKKTRLSLFLSGLFLGLSIHHHYLSFFATASFLFFTLIQSAKNKTLSSSAWLIPGYALAILPFVIFDLTHPPGLFLSQFKAYQQAHLTFNVMTILLHFLQNLFLVIRHYTVNTFSSVLLFFYTLVLVWHDFRHSQKNWLYLAVWLMQILGVSFITESVTYYFLPGLTFFLIYLFLPRGKKLNTAILSTIFLINGSLLSIIPQITTQKYIPVEWQTNIRTVEAITDILHQEIQQENLSGVNLTVLGSSDPNRYGWKYRSLLEIKGTHIMSKYEYFVNNYLFVISPQTAEALRADPSPEMERFRHQKLRRSWQVEGSEWNVYLFSF